MRIVHLVASMEVGGAEMVTASLCRMQRRSGHEVAIHCLLRKGPLGEQMEAEGFTVTVHGQGKRFPTMASIYRGLRSGGWDIGHCHNILATVWGAPMMRAAGVRAVVSTRHSLVLPPYDVRQELQYSFCARLCSYVVGVCRATSQNLANAPLAAKGRIVTVYNGAAEPRGTGTAIPRGDGSMIFVTVARLALPKDHDTLLRAVAEMRKSVPGAVLWIVGDGERRAALEKLGAELGLGESVKFWGERQNPGDFLRSADVFVLSSLSEGVPMSVLEAMAVGLPAIVSDVGGMAEVVRQADAGAVVPRSDVAGLAAAMRSFAADRAGARSTGAHAQAHYRNHFTLQCMADEYEKLYRQAMTK